MRRQEEDRMKLIKKLVKVTVKLIAGAVVFGLFLVAVDPGGTNMKKLAEKLKKWITGKTSSLNFDQEQTDQEAE